MSVIEEILKEAVNLAIQGGVGLPVVLGIILVVAIVLVLAKKYAGWKLPGPSSKPEQPKPWDEDHPTEGKQNWGGPPQDWPGG